MKEHFGNITKLLFSAIFIILFISVPAHAHAKSFPAAKDKTITISEAPYSGFEEGDEVFSHDSYSFNVSKPLTCTMATDGIYYATYTLTDESNGLQLISQYSYDSDYSFKINLAPGNYTIDIYTYSKSYGANAKIKFKSYSKNSFTYNVDKYTDTSYKGFPQYVGSTLTFASTLKNAKYSVGNKDLASINSKGLATFKKAGQTYITVKNSKYTIRYKMHILKPQASSYNSKQVTAGFKTKLFLENADTWSKKTPWTWKSSDKSIATVDKYGEVTGHKKGTVTITASCFSYSIKMKVKVVDNVFDAGLKKSDINPYQYDYQNNGSFYAYLNKVKYNSNGSISLSFYLSNISFNRTITGFIIKLYYGNEVFAGYSVDGLKTSFKSYDVKEFTYTIPKGNVYKSVKDIDLVNNYLKPELQINMYYNYN